MADRALICVFAKPPMPGRVKTRLAIELGQANAAALARAFLQDTWSVASEIARVVLATTEGAAADFGLRGAPEIWMQGAGDLGQRIERVLRRGLAEADTVIAIGADAPGLPARLLERAVQELEQYDGVLGPCDDGGFYLLGLRRCPPGLLEELPWSSTNTFAATQQRLTARGISVAILDGWFDVDRPEDLERLRRSINRGEVEAPATKKLLTGLSPPEPSA
jgi:rSAM/selenodomain-associated transferase 1